MDNRQRYLGLATLVVLVALVACGAPSPTTHSLDVATFGIGAGTVTSNPPGIDCGEECRASFAASSTVTLIASPADGSVFVGWSGCDSVDGEVCTVAMSSNRSVTARFSLDEPTTYTLTVSNLGTGSGTVSSIPPGIDCGDDCQASFVAGEVVVLEALPAPHSYVASWSGCASIDGNLCSVAMTTERSVSVSFMADAPQTGAIGGTLIFPGVIGVQRSADALGPGRTEPSPSSSRVRVVPGEIVVRFAPGAPQVFGTMRVANVTLSLARRLAAAGLELYRAAGLSEEETLALVAALRARSDVLDAFPNWVLSPLATPDDEFFELQWHYGAIDLPAAWDIEDGTSRSVVVAVVDTGSSRHPDLQANLLPGYDFVDDDADATDLGGLTNYHGTHVAGTVAAVTNNAIGVAGVNWGARVVPVRVIGATGHGTMVDVIDGIIWGAGNPAAEPGLPPNPHPAQVVNISVGGNIGEACPLTLDFTFGQLIDSGVVLVAAAGNDGGDARHVFPANCENVIAVGATGPTNRRAPYSNYGAVIDLMAPGGDTSKSIKWLR